MEHRKMTWKDLTKDEVDEAMFFFPGVLVTQWRTNPEKDILPHLLAIKPAIDKHKNTLKETGSIEALRQYYDSLRSFRRQEIRDLETYLTFATASFVAHYHWDSEPRQQWRPDDTQPFPSKTLHILKRLYPEQYLDGRRSEISDDILIEVLNVVQNAGNVKELQGQRRGTFSATFYEMINAELVDRMYSSLSERQLRVRIKALRKSGVWHPRVDLQGKIKGL